MVSPSWSFITFKMLPAGWKPIRLLHSPSLDIPENGTSLYSLTRKKKGKNRGGRSGLFHNSDLKNKSFVYIKTCNIEDKIRRESFTLVKGAIVLNDLISI